MNDRCIQIEVPTTKYSKIMLLGEAPGEEEEKKGKPFIGKAGKLLDSLLEDAGLLRSSCVVTNVFHIRPPKNKVDHFFGAKDEADEKLVPYPFRERLFLKKEFGEEMGRLFDELKRWKPKVVIALGATALWAMTGKHKISEHHGEPITVQGHIVLPVFHPAFLIYSHNKSYNEMVIKVLQDAKEFANV